MNHESTTTDPSTDDIRHQMEETRSHLAGQVEVLEHEVMDMVHDATEAVSGTIKSVKESVGETVEAVEDAVKGAVSSAKHALDVSAHVREHPWLMMAGAIALGYFVGSFVFRSR